MAQGGKRKAAKRAARTAIRLEPAMLVAAAGVTFCVIAWGYLVTAAIDFGAAARDGQSVAWVYLGIACLGAAACLFAGLMLGARVLASLGLTGADPAGHDSAPPEPAPPRPAGGRRARR